MRHKGESEQERTIGEPSSSPNLSASPPLGGDSNLTFGLNCLPPEVWHGETLKLEYESLKVKPHKICYGHYEKEKRNV